MHSLAYPDGRHCLSPIQRKGSLVTLRDESWRRDRSVYHFSPHAVPRSAYFHVPFCRHRCGYCDFTLLADRDDLIGSWLSALANELSTVANPVEVDSIFVGGGTPTHLTVTQIEHFLTLIRARFRLAASGEFTVEANPEDLTDEMVEALQAGGVNRISLGVQSLDPDVLLQLERTHRPQDAADTVQRVADAISNVSLDLIFGVPGQTLACWKDTLAQAADLPIQHISTYGLTFEKGTTFYQRRSKGEFQLLSSDDERAQYDLAMQLLPLAGFQQYEISNFARQHHRCRHNQVYWNAEEYFAFGPGAARYLSGVRSTNSRNVTRWIESWLKDRPLLQDREELSPEDRAREAVMLGLRCCDGIPLNEFRSRFDTTPEELASEAMARHTAAGLLETVENSDDVWRRLTAAGRCLADTVIVDFL